MLNMEIKILKATTQRITKKKEGIQMNRNEARDWSPSELRTPSFGFSSQLLSSAQSPEIPEH